MIILINQNNHLNRIKRIVEFLGVWKIKLGHRISEGLDFKLVNKYGILTLMDDNEIWTNHWRIKLRHLISLKALDFK